MIVPDSVAVVMIPVLIIGFLVFKALKFSQKVASEGGIGKYFNWKRARLLATALFFIGCAFGTILSLLQIPAHGGTNESFECGIFAISTMFFVLSGGITVIAFMQWRDDVQSVV